MSECQNILNEMKKITTELTSMQLMVSYWFKIIKCKLYSMKYLKVNFDQCEHTISKDHVGKICVIIDTSKIVENKSNKTINVHHVGNCISKDKSKLLEMMINKDYVCKLNPIGRSQIIENVALKIKTGRQVCTTKE